MNRTTLIFIIGICIGFVVGIGLTLSIVHCLVRRRKPTKVDKSISHRAVTIPVNVKGYGSNSTLSEGEESPRTSEWSNMTLWLENLRRSSAVSVCGIPKYSYKDVQRATSNFTTIIGNGAFGPVYKAQMATGGTVAVKVLGTNSRQGEQEFLTEVLLLGRLHHRNLVDLVGYVADKGKHMLLYTYMSNGSLASHLYDFGKSREPMNWDLRLGIALDVARGLEYLHCGASPPVVHRDIKSCNILLDQFMKAKVTDFGLSRPEMIIPRTSNIRGTFGYLDPEYLSTRTFTKKSDVYSFGVLLFELITGRNPQLGLMEYVKLAAMEGGGKVGWEEIVDEQLNGKYDVHNLNDMASLAFICVNEVSQSRPTMCEIVQALSQLCKRNGKTLGRTSSAAALKDVSIELDQIEAKDFTSTASTDILGRLHSR
ncbi:calcium/calmodulin-regulated receptor-like kinase 1 isoform X1 [Vigna radiata var. radiata]|uniref:Calcium/calmodulin-regulated receptor-like kinase 1 isoform X1 n=1 Tax=Vigna radiata var. radiata TaxID=3916 RepID=A0A1S3UPU2_VIGRR|nr:calcium/calmodulin-regulated receptor-like kinase 1 isoform X1 [Vigna radiata var. radiata]XP_014508087.1 calcium/calmodulin-regulated receptor-like kinase 1 isoform X1 [Vigna radiata var. radiata]XP_022639226.1 calcium/calmodulin-regulated receptor-like kinase 1 isoform X1 [Vigna radiata var. radiata]XP_022639227.1 calcium/calmodulin-regulated receptor-like kinase 1 isoform X1 [Vigna radiata var. radiata]XP_022639228.1 calcium/calmodulin-regulated receptor-like kinase 1 isoform X1 [Vigna ra